MIKITKPGQTVFYAFCNHCGCEFTYEISDLQLVSSDNKVSCPTCGKYYYHPAMVQNPTIPGGIGYQWPSDNSDPCAGCVWRNGCVWRKNLLRDGLYIGDIPCNECGKNKFNTTTSVQPSIEDSIIPCVNQFDPRLTTPTFSELNGTKYVHSNSENQEDPVQETVMSTIYNACRACREGLAGGQVIGNHNCTNNLNNCGDTECHNSCSVDKKYNSKKNCKGKH